jgi:hypothetical protein
MATQPLTILAAMQGTYVINDTTAWTGKCDGVYTLTDTVFSVLTDSDANDKDEYISTAANAVPAGCLIRPIGDAQFTAITLTSGEVALIL